LRDIPDDVDLSVDMRPAREAHDAAVVTLARAVARRKGIIIGLSHRQATVLGYVGQLTAALERNSWRGIG
jgi:hypothetical protein